MQATLVYNSNAGPTATPTAEEIQEALAAAGFEPSYRPTSSEQDLDEVLATVEGIAVCAGGDGTVRAVATRLMGRGVPLLVLPMGTANNISQSLGQTDIPLDLVRALPQAIRVPFDMGVVSAPWGQDYFLEGAGFGLYADVLAVYDPDQGKSLWRVLQACAHTWADKPPHPGCIEIDGEQLTAQFHLMEALNTPAVGPRMKLAPGASTSDGLLDVICIEEGDREGLISFLTNLVREDLERLDIVTVRQAREIRFRWWGYPLHVDGVVMPSNPEEHPEWMEGEITIGVIPGAFEVLVPASTNTEESE